MEELTLTTPALLFSAISLIMLAYTNRFLAYAAVVRSLHEKYQKKKDDNLIRQIKNLRQRLYLTRSMQIFGISSLLLCVITMFLIYVKQHIIAVWVFGISPDFTYSLTGLIDQGNSNLGKSTRAPSGRYREPFKRITSPNEGILLKQFEFLDYEFDHVPCKKLT